MSTDSASSAMRWRSRPPTDVAWFNAPPDFVAFHTSSGRTHFLNEASKILLVEFLTEPKGLAEVLEFFAVEVADDVSDVQVEQFREMLLHLEELGLIEQS